MSIPRVTEILRSYTSYDKVPPQILGRAAERGTSVHAICAGIAKDVWIPDSMINEELLGYVNSFKAWSDAQVDKYLVIEKRYIDEDRKFSGQLDFLVTCKDLRTYLVDIKTSARPQKTYPIQMAAYQLLLNKHGTSIDGAMLVYLNKNGEFPNVHTMDDLADEQRIFLAALDCWHYFNKGKHD
jgi:predicted RecB family nuclease